MEDTIQFSINEEQLSMMVEPEEEEVPCLQEKERAFLQSCHHPNEYAQKRKDL